MSRFTRELLKNMPEIKYIHTEKPIDGGCCNKTISKLLVSKEQFFVDKDKADIIFNCSPQLLMTEYKEFLESDESLSGGRDGEKFHKGKFMHNVAELFLDIPKLIISKEYLRHIRTCEDGFDLNIYGGKTSRVIPLKDGETPHIGHVSSLLTNCMQERHDFIIKQDHDFGFIEPDNATVTTITDVYKDTLYVSDSRNEVAAFATNVPIHVYGKQILPANIFTYDLKEKEYMVGGMSIDAINVMIEDIATNGFDEPLIMRVCNACMVPIDNTTAVKSFIAYYLKLPTIPVIMYMTDDRQLKNDMIDELYHCMYLQTMNNYRIINEMNTVCYPYFNFQLIGAEKSVEKTNKNRIDPNQYKVMNNVDKNINALTYDRYLDPSVPAQNKLIYVDHEDEIPEVVKEELDRLTQALQREMTAKHSETIERIKNGEY